MNSLEQKDQRICGWPLPKNSSAFMPAHFRAPKGRFIPAQGKRSVALGQSPKMNTSLFSKLGWQGQPNFEKREISGCDDYQGGGHGCLPLYVVALSGRRAKRTEGEQIT
jgi:hypothetical protein